MYKITWDKETGGVLLHTHIVEGTLGISPRPVFYEELDLIGLDKAGWTYPRVGGQQVSVKQLLMITIKQK